MFEASYFENLAITRAILKILYYKCIHVSKLITPNYHPTSKLGSAYTLYQISSADFQVLIACINSFHARNNKLVTAIPKPTDDPALKLCPRNVNPLNAELNPICYLLALLGAHHFLHVSRIRVKTLTLRLLMSYIYIYIYIWSTYS